MRTEHGEAPGKMEIGVDRAGSGLIDSRDLAVQARGLKKAFGATQAVAGVDLAVPAGEIFGLVGPDGAGKTTLLRMICGLITPDSGSAAVLGRAPDQLGEMRGDLGYMPQRFSLYGDLTVEENLRFFGSLYGLTRQEIAERAAEILEMTGLAPFTGRFADALSGGMRQKLSLTCSLITRPRVLILDEPTYGVDPESRKEFWRILYRLNQDGMTVVVSTPYMDEAELCHRVAFMNGGIISVVDTPEGLKVRFGHQVLEVRASSRDPQLLDGLPGVLETSFYGDKYHVVTGEPEACTQAIKERLGARGVELSEIRETEPSMEDIFVSLVEHGWAG